MNSAAAMVAMVRYAEPGYDASTTVSDRPPAMQSGALRRIEGERVALRALHQGRNESFVADGIRQLAFDIRGTLDARAKAQDGTETPESLVATMAFQQWASDAGYMHQHGTLTQVFARAVHAMMHKGGGYLHRIVSRATADDIADPHRNGLMVQALSAMDIDRNRGSDGREFNAEGRLTGIWFKSRMADDYHIDVTPVLVPASDLYTMEIADDTSATRAVPWGTAALKAAAEVARADAARLGAEEWRATVGAIALASDRHPAMRGRHIDTDATIQDGDGYDTREIQNGTILIARGIDKVEWSPSQGQNQTTATRVSRVAAGLGMPVQAVTRDLADTSFSAARLLGGMKAETVQDIVERGGVDGAKQRLLQWFLQREVQLGNDWTALKWTWRMREPLEADPLKSAQAKAVLLEMRLASRRQLIEQSGGDFEAVDGQIQKEDRDVETAA